MIDRFGPQKWWPGDGEFETIVGAILTQNTNWRNVEKALNNLKQNESLDMHTLYEMDIDTLAQLIRPAGYYNIKAKRLKSFLAWLYDNYDGSLESLGNMHASTLREELLSIKGVGPETADSIVLYAFEKPTFVVDTYTCRIMIRHGLIEPEARYEQTREFFESCLNPDVPLFNEFHALFVRVGKEFCKPKPKCSGCPLEHLPHETEQPW